jgi:SAM-dependent methyltransferase
VALPQGQVDYDAIYRGDSAFGELIEDRAPWDIGEPQPVVRDLVTTGQVNGDVLDAGCGLGQNAVLFAEHGHHVTAFDAAPNALERGRRLAAEHGVDVSFQLADATDLPDFGREFDTIVDSALYHCLNEPQRRDYVRALRERAKPGGVLHLLCFSDARPAVSPAAHHISEAELREVFATGWELEHLRAATIVTSLTRTAIERIAAASGRDAEDMLASFTTDERGRYGTPAWLLTARRS